MRREGAVGSIFSPESPSYVKLHTDKAWIYSLARKPSQESDDLASYRRDGIDVRDAIHNGQQYVLPSGS